MQELGGKESAMDFIPWMVDSRIEFSKAIAVKNSKLGGNGVFAQRPIHKDDVLLKVPKSSVLSSKTCAIGDLLRVEEDMELQNKLVVSYLFERSQGKNSPWYPYIRFVEEAPLPDVPMLWSPEERKWLRGTNITTWDVASVETVRESYEEVLPFLRRHSELFLTGSPTFEDFLRATLIISSRAFDVDNYHELALVPFACLFNHSDREHVHFESDGDVCIRCGDMGCDCIINEDEENGEDQSSSSDWEDEIDDKGSEDGHATGIEEESVRERPNSSVSGITEESDDDDSEAYSADEDNVCELRAVSSVSAGNEIFNTYGEDPNGVLLARYGFAIWNNSHDVVNLEVEVEEFAHTIKKLKSLRSWLERQEIRLDTDNEVSDEILFLGLINENGETRLSMGLISLAKKLGIDKSMFATQLAQLRYKKFVLQGSSRDIYNLAEIEHNQRKKMALYAVGSEKLMLERYLSKV